MSAKNMAVTQYHMLRVSAQYEHRWHIKYNSMNYIVTNIQPLQEETCTGTMVLRHTRDNVFQDLQLH